MKTIRSRNTALSTLLLLTASSQLLAENRTPVTAAQPPVANAASTGGFSVEGLIESRSLTTGGFKFPDGSIQTTAMDASCAAGSAIRRITPDGTVICETDDVGTGTVTSITAGTGLAGGTIATSGTLSVAPGGITESLLANDAVTTAKIAAGAVDTSELKDGAVTPEKLSYPFKASSPVGANKFNPPQDNAVLSGINTYPNPGTGTVFGLYGQATDSSSNNGIFSTESAGIFGRGFGGYAYGVKGFAGNLSFGTYHYPIGAIGVVGIGVSRGMFASSDSGTGLYASSQDNYGIWGESTNYRGIAGRTGQADDNYGLYTPDNLWAKNYNSSGVTAKVFKYTGNTEIRPGDVVSFSGIQAGGNLDDEPMVTVDSTMALPQAAIAGVVSSRFDMEAVREDEPDGAMLDPTPDGNIKPGDYVLVVEGAAAVNVDPDETPLSPGSLLVSDAENRSIETVSPNRYAPASSAPSTGQTIGVVLGALAPAAKKGDRVLQNANADQPKQVYVYVSPR